jgi:hypothetical protein
MNERIEELLYETGARYNGYHLTGETRLYTEDVDYEKFAELIVRECANRASWAQDTGEKDIGGEVLKHFGVEE